MSPNRLKGERSPYLQAHADDPVDWFPWGEEAFREARAKDKPVFVSIGYSACHWCHVMHRESFRDPEVARLLNEAFVCIKVDREERPDLDDYFMEVCQRMTGTGGWPLSVLLTPEGEPFFAATYLPKESRFGRIGLVELVRRVSDLWKGEREKILSLAREVAKGAAKPPAGKADPEALIRRAYRALKGLYDPMYGGFGHGPKFPTVGNLLFLLRYFRREGDPEALSMVLHQLRAMRWSGIYDQVGGGIHRYAVDRKWMVPHFEKMLYDQALVALAFSEAYQAAKDPFLAEAAWDIFDYCLRVLRAPDGGFYTSEDSESEGEEGKFYLWSETELKGILDASDFQWVKEAFGILPQGNYRDEVTSQRTGLNILHWQVFPDELARATGVSEGEVLRRWSSIRRKLALARSKRVPPLKDEKILADQNGLMIAALSLGARVLGREELLEEARSAWSFVEERLWGKEGLRHRYAYGEAAVQGMLEDYAFLGYGLLALYQASLDTRYIEACLRLCREADKRLWDEREGGFFQSRGDSVVPARKVYHEGALPSGQAMMAVVLLSLFRITGERTLGERAHRQLEVLSASAREAPWAFPYAMVALDMALGPSWELVVVGEGARAWIRSLDGEFFPEGICLYGDDHRLRALCPHLEAVTRPPRGVRAYLCRDFACETPSEDLEGLMEKLRLAGRRR